MKTEILLNLIRALDETTKIQAEYVGILEEMRSQKLFLLHLIEKARLPEEVYVPKVVDPDFAYLLCHDCSTKLRHQGSGACYGILQKQRYQRNGILSWLQNWHQRANCP